MVFFRSMLPHTPVLLTTVLDILQPKSGESVLDVTIGLGGHSEAFLRATSPHGSLTGLDADSRNLQYAKERLKTSADRTTFIHANFRDLPACLSGRKTFDIVFADLGLSSPHVDDPQRGFSFRETSPLDMRFDQSKRRGTASELLMSASLDELIHLFQNYGQLPRTHRFAKEIVRSRVQNFLRTSDDLRIVVERVFHSMAPKVMPQIFQALRIAVNDEIGSLTHFLHLLPHLMTEQGRVGIISYHSLEDRLVKQTFKEFSLSPKDPQTGAPLNPPLLHLLTRKPLSPSPAEIENNPRARSAHLRAAAIHSSVTC